MIEFLTNLGFWNWVFLGLVLIALETIVPGVHFLWFGLAALVVGLLAFIAGSEFFSWPWQLVVYALISVASVFWVRGFSRREQSLSDLPDLNVRAAQYIGRVVIVEDAISGGRGKVRVGDTLWPAQGSDAAKGAQVRVTGTNGTVLVVEAV